MAQPLKQHLSQRFRTRRDVRLREVLTRAPRAGAALRILDLGGRTEYWQRLGYDYLVEQGARITLLNMHESEIVPDPSAPEGLFEWAVGDACKLDHADHVFDFCHSNSVIEHVGLWRDMEAFAREARRVAPSHYVQTPNFWFPVEPHFWAFPMNHWLPRPVRAGLMRRMKLATSGKAADIGKAYEYVDSARLLTRGQMQFLFPDSTIETERLALMAKSLIAIHIAPMAAIARPLQTREDIHG